MEGPFVLDTLLKEGKKLQDAMLEEYEKYVGHLKLDDKGRDPRLLELLRKIEAVPLFDQEIKAIKAFVEDKHEEWLTIWRTFKDDSEQSSKTKGKSGTKLIHELAGAFAKFPEKEAPILGVTGALPRILAACAYEKGAKFGFSVAFQVLCQMKASSHPSGAGHERTRPDPRPVTSP